MAHIKIAIMAHSESRLKTLLKEKIQGEVNETAVFLASQFSEVKKERPQIMITDEGETVSIEQMLWGEHFTEDEAQEAFWMLFNAYLLSHRDTPMHIAVVECHI